MSSGRFMRVMIMFDLPVETSRDRTNYTRFRKYLINEGFIMLQQSIYTKIVLNQTIMQSLHNRIKKNMPEKGLVQMLTITEKQFASIELMCGEDPKGEKVNSTDRMVVI